MHSRMTKKLHQQFPEILIKKMDPRDIKFWLTAEIILTSKLPKSRFSIENLLKSRKLCMPVRHILSNLYKK